MEALYYFNNWFYSCIFIYLSHTSPGWMLSFSSAFNGWLSSTHELKLCGPSFYFDSDSIRFRPDHHDTRLIDKINPVGFSDLVFCACFTSESNSGNHNCNWSHFTWRVLQLWNYDLDIDFDQTQTLSRITIFLNNLIVSFLISIENDIIYLILRAG